MTLYLTILLFTILQTGLSREECSASTRTLGRPTRLIMQEHNRYRSIHGQPSICYGSDTATFSAEPWARIISTRPELIHSAYYNRGVFGESLARNTGDKSEEMFLFTAIRDWFDLCNFIPVSELTRTDVKRDEHVESCLQILTAKNIECGWDRKVLVCQYWPAVKKGFPVIPKANDWKSMDGKMDRRKFIKRVWNDQRPQVVQVKVPPERLGDTLLNVTFSSSLYDLDLGLDISYIDLNKPDSATALDIGCGKFPLDSEVNKTWKTLVFSYNVTGNLDWRYREARIAVNGKEIADIAPRKRGCFQAEFQLHNTDLNWVDITTAGWPFDTRMLTKITDPLPISDKFQTDDSKEGDGDGNKGKSGDDGADKGSNNEESNNEESNSEDKEGDNNEEDGANDRLLPDEDSILFTEAPHGTGDEIDIDGKKVVFPQVHVTFMEAETHQVTIFMDYSGEFEGVSDFQLILVPDKVEDKDAFKTTVNTYEMAKASFKEKEGELRVPYITAEFNQLPDHFVIGDGLNYGEYFNGPLLVAHGHAKYSVRVRGVVKGKKGKRIFIDSDILGMFDTATVSYAGLGFLAVISLVTFGACYSARARKKRRMKEVAVALHKLNALVNERADERDDDGVRREVSQWEREEWWSVSTAGVPMNYEEQPTNEDQEGTHHYSY